jgi:arylsulfatase
MEGGVRTPCIIRWPGRIPAGRTTDEIVHELDLFPTLAAAIGAPQIVPTDRAIDGVNQLPLLEGKQNRSVRESVLMFVNNQVRAVKWHEWKLHYVYAPEAGAPPQPPLMRLFNLRSDPKEETDIKDAHPWAQSVMDRLVDEFMISTKRFPNVPANAADPYQPPKSN